MYVTLDLETSTGVLHKRKGSPYLASNQVVMAGYKFHQAPRAVAVDYPEDGLLGRLLKDRKFLVTFNGKFDVQHLIRTPKNYTAWMDWVAGGGIIWDCQIVEYLLKGMAREEHMLSLDEVAPRYGGHVKVDEVKALWEAGVKTEDIDPDLLRMYLVGDGKDHIGDVGNTERIFLKQYAAAKKAGQLRSIILNMGALLATTEMERNGMFINKPKALELAEGLRAELAQVTAEVEGYIPPGLPFEFNWNSRFHKSALIFGGEVKYKTRMPKLDDDGNPTYRMKEVVEPVLDDNGQPVLFGSGKNKGQPKTRKSKVPDLDKPISTIQEAVYLFPGYATPKPQWQGSDPGVYSVSSDVIEELGETQDVPFIKALARMAMLQKDLGTYFISEDGTKGLLTLVGDDGIVHHSLHHNRTVTARLSSSDPNLQNVSAKGPIKQAIESRWGGRGSLLASDFTSLEVYGQALLTQDRQLIADLRLGLDMHCKRLSQVEDVPYETVVEWAKSNEENKRKPEWVEKRKNIKVYSFQRAYGAGANKIASFLDLPVEVVEKWIEADDAMYPDIPKYYDFLTKEIERSRRPTARFEMHPAIKGARVQLGRGQYRTPDGKLYVYEEQPSPEYIAKRGKLASFSPTEIRNYVVQGTGGEWMKAALWLLVREFYRRHNFDGKALLVNTVHDASYVDAHESVKAKAAHLLHVCMEEASAYMEFLFDWPVPVPTPAETTWGPSWAEETLVPLQPKVLSALRRDIRRRYMNAFIPSFEQPTE